MITCRHCLALILLCCSARLSGGERLDYQTTWLGNSFPADPGWVPHNIADLHVLPNGTVVTNVPWEENGAQVSLFKDGKWIDSVHFTGNWRGGVTVTANSKHLFFGMRLRNQKSPIVPGDEQWFGVCRVNLDDVNSGDAFEQGVHGNDTRGPFPKNTFLPLHKIKADKTIIGWKQITAHVAGLAADDRHLVMSCPFDGTLRVLDAATMKPMSTWRVAGTGEVALFRQTIWALQPSKQRVLAFDLTGQPLGQIDLPETTVPTDVAFTPQGKLLVCDAGPNEQILQYDVSDPAKPRCLDSIGQPGGVYAGTPGCFEPMQFLHLQGAGFDRDGNLYVGNKPGGNGSTLIQSYSPDGQMRWAVECQLWMEGVGVDPKHDRTVYGIDVRYQIDYDTLERGPPLASAFTTDRHAYPTDPRASHGDHGLRGRPWIRYLNQADKYMFVATEAGRDMHIYRFEGEITIPCGEVGSEEIWIDTDGDGQRDDNEVKTFSIGKSLSIFADSQGVIWIPMGKKGIYRLPISRFTDRGVPVYEAQHCELLPLPRPLTEIRRMLHDHDRNLTILNGFTQTYPRPDKWHWKRGGIVVCAYENFGRSEQRLLWQFAPPFEVANGGNGGDGNVTCIAMAGDYLFLARNGSSRELGIERGHVDVYTLRDQRHVGFFEPPTDWGQIGIIDVVHALEAIHRDNGEYVVFLEDNGKGKQVVYRWKP